jgi:uncharacterized YccA/Bax inhibitor family protein
MIRAGYISTMTKTFLKDLIERAVKTFAQAMLGFFVGSVTILTVDWTAALAISGTMVLASILTSLLSFSLKDNGTASLVSEVVDEDEPGRHEAP